MLIALEWKNGRSLNFRVGKVRCLVLYLTKESESWTSRNMLEKNEPVTDSFITAYSFSLNILFLGFWKGKWIKHGTGRDLAVVRCPSEARRDACIALEVNGIYSWRNISCPTLANACIWYLGGGGGQSHSWCSALLFRVGLKKHFSCPASAYAHL